MKINGTIVYEDDDGARHTFVFSSMDGYSAAHKVITNGPQISTIVDQYIQSQLVFTGNPKDVLNGNTMVADFKAWKRANGYGAVSGGRNTLYAEVKTNDQVLISNHNNRLVLKGLYAKTVRKTECLGRHYIASALEADELI